MKIKFLVLLLLVVSSSYAQTVVTFKSEYNRTGLYSEEDILFNSWKQVNNSIKFSNNEITVYGKDTLTIVTEPDNMSDRDDVGVWKAKVNSKPALVIFIIEVDIKVAYLTLVYKEDNSLIQYKFSQQSKQSL